MKNVMKLVSNTGNVWTDVTLPYLVKNATFLGLNIFGEKVFQKGSTKYVVDGDNIWEQKEIF